MSLLASLTRAYRRMADRGEVPPFGYSRVSIDFCISLTDSGVPTGAPIDLRTKIKNKLVGQRKEVPTWLNQRTSGIAPYFLWDKSAYCLGLTNATATRTADEHQAFIDLNSEALSNVKDPGLLAFRRFLGLWKPDDFRRYGWSEEVIDSNIIFALERDRRSNGFLHERSEARRIWNGLLSEAETFISTCLITGENGRMASSHPPIKGVWGAQTSGAFIVSNNARAFESYGKREGKNAPVSEGVAFAYTTVLNQFLGQNSQNRIQIGDTSTVFWADASDVEAAKEAEGIFADFNAPDEAIAGKKVGTLLQKIRNGQPVENLTPELPQGVRFHVLGLAPNAARLSVRFNLEDDFAEIGANYLRHVKRMRIEPPPREANSSLKRLLLETATLFKSENIPPNLVGETLRSILTGHPYPLTLLSTLLMRMRTDKQVRALRVGLLKAILMENFRYRVPEDGRDDNPDKDRKEVPVSLDRDNKDPGYLLGRLFAAFEYAQTAALGAGINATIRDQYYGTASATPRAIFPILQRKATHHLSKLRKEMPGRARWLDGEIGEIFDLADPQELFAPTLSMQRQALFAIGYYHQRNEFYRKKDAPETSEEAA